MLALWPQCNSDLYTCMKDLGASIFEATVKEGYFSTFLNHKVDIF